MNDILITGNKLYGLAGALYKIYPQATFISRSSGYDLCNEQDIVKLCELSLNYNIFINNSALYHFYQTWLFDKIWKTWVDNNKSGYIINVGSTTDRTAKGSSWIYQVEKKSLREISNDRALLSVWGKSKIKISYISLGSLNTTKVSEKHPDRKLIDLSLAADYFKWLINQPPEININELSFDHIQY